MGGVVSSTRRIVGLVLVVLVASVMIPLGKLRCARKIISGANVHLCHKIRP